MSDSWTARQRGGGGVQGTLARMGAGGQCRGGGGGAGAGAAPGRPPDTAGAAAAASKTITRRDNAERRLIFRFSAYDGQDLEGRAPGKRISNN